MQKNRKLRDSDHVQVLCEEFERAHGTAGLHASQQLQAWTSGAIFGSHTDAIIGLVRLGERELLLDEFWRMLPFGTGGRRGPVGFGPNRINQTTIGLTVQGHCDYLRERYRNGEQLSVVVANDVRVFNDVSKRYGSLTDLLNPLVGISSRSLAKLACEIYAANDIRAYLEQPECEKATLTTPELSFAIRQLGALGGINVSASHNHPDDNGIKVYASDGAQLIPPHDEELTWHVEQARNVSTVQFNQATAEGRIVRIPASVHEQYVELYVRQFESRCGTTFGKREPIVYTPLCGCGERTILPILRRIGFDVIVPEEQGPDGSFAAIPFLAPNPEIAEATKPATSVATRVGSTLVLSSDPDADRIGVDVEVNGTWHHMNGNQIAAVLAYFLLADTEGPRIRGLVVVTTVTTRLIGSIATVLGLPKEENLLIGFKYIGDAIGKLNLVGSETAGQLGSELVLAAEESHGVLTTTAIRDKDAASGAMYLAHLHDRLAKDGSNLLEYYSDILRQHGPHAELGRSIVLPGRTGFAEMASLMHSLRKRPLSDIGGESIIVARDFLSEEEFGKYLSETDRSARDMLQWETERFVVTIRPSGTEPKVKLYVHRRPSSEEQWSAIDRLKDESELLVHQVAAQVYGHLLARLGRHLSPEALQLPDVVTLDEKELFDTWLRPELEARLESRDFGADSTVSWLQEAGARLTPGADPLLAMWQALASMAAKRRLGDETLRSRRLREVVTLIGNRT